MTDKLIVPLTPHSQLSSKASLYACNRSAYRTPFVASRVEYSGTLYACNACITRARPLALPHAHPRPFFPCGSSQRGRPGPGGPVRASLLHCRTAPAPAAMRCARACPHVDTSSTSAFANRVTLRTGSPGAFWYGLLTQRVSQAMVSPRAARE
jgi:hypothetical protein